MQAKLVLAWSTEVALCIMMSMDNQQPYPSACSFGWACSLLDREEVLLADLV